jgi:glycosyltransferase involved in cell wall biosynthesis
MKVLWVSSRIFEKVDEKQSGVWQKALAEKLADHKELILGNISYQDGIKETTYSVYRTIHQWGIPRIGKVNNGMPPKKVCRLFSETVKEFNPDIIHVWGSENPFKLLPFKDNIPGKKVLAMQGVLSSIENTIFMGLSLRDSLSTFGIREILTQSSLWSIRRSFRKESQVEEQIIKSAEYIITQSDWTDSQVKPINTQATYYRTIRTLRKPFIDCNTWLNYEHKKHVLYTTSWGYSLKGLHVLLKALAIVKHDIPDVELRIAGAYGRCDFLGDGYFRFVLRLIRKLGLQHHVVWLGGIEANEIVKNLQQASVFVHTSFVESYSVALAEAMSVGTPSVVTFAGAMSELADNNKEALFFTIGDYKRCAHLIIKLLCDEKLSTEISQNALKRSLERNKFNDVATNQMNIYRKILGMATDC